MGTPATNISVDLGDDGTNEFTFVGTLNSTTSPQQPNLTAVSNAYNTIKSFFS